MQIRPIILANGGSLIQGTSQTQLVTQGQGDSGAITPADFPDLNLPPGPFRIKGGYLWVYQEGNGQLNAAGNDTWITTDFTKNHIPGSSNPIDAASILQINKLEPHNPFNGQNFSAFDRVDFGNDWVLANDIWVWTQPQSGTNCYVYAQIYVYTDPLS